MSNKVTVKMDGIADLEKLLSKFPKLVIGSNAPQDRAVKKAATILAQRMRQIAPDSRKTRSRDKQSASSKNKWPATLRTQVKVKQIKYAVVSWAQVGPKSPEGNAAHFMQEKPRRHILWGKAQSAQPFRILRNWHTRAFDETKNEQMTAMAASLRDDLDKLVST